MYSLLNFAAQGFPPPAQFIWSRPPPAAPCCGGSRQTEAPESKSQNILHKELLCQGIFGCLVWPTSLGINSFARINRQRGQIIDFFYF